MTPANWGGAAPSGAGTDQLVFPAVALQKTNTNNFTAGTTFQIITFTGSGYNLQGNAVVFAALGGVAQGVAGTNTISLPTTAAFSIANVSNAGGLLVYQGDVDVGAGLWQINGAGNTTVNSRISGTGDVTKLGAGTLTYGGGTSNTYSGTTSVEDGTLQLNKSAPLAIAGPLTIGAGSGPDVVRLLVNDQIADTVAVTINPTGLLDLNGFSDAVNLLTGSGNITLGGSGTLTVGASGGTSTFNGTIGGTGNLTKAGAGTFTLAGTAANTYTGTTTVNVGTLQLGKPPTFNAIGGPLVVGDGTGADTLKLLNGDQIPDGVSVSVRSSGRLDLNGAGETVGSLELRSGPVTGAQVMSSVGTPTLTLAGDVTLVPDGTGSLGASIASSVILSLGPSARTFTVADGAAFADLVLLTVVTGSGTAGVTKAGPGTLQFAGSTANTYPGTTTTVNEGTLLLSKPAGIAAIPGPLVVGDGVGPGTDTLTLTNLNQIADGAAVTGGSTGLLNVGGGSETIGALSLVSGTTSGAQVTTFGGTLTLGGDVTVTGNGAMGATITGTGNPASGNLNLGSTTRTFSVASGAPPGAADLEVSGVIAGSASAGVSKTGTGKLRFSGSTANTHPGVTGVTTGVLELQETPGTNAIPGGLTIGGAGTARLLANDQMPDTASIAVLASGLLDLFGSSDVVGG